MDRLNTEAADLERRATHAEQAAPLRQTAQQQRAQADEAKQRAQRALTDMKAFENTRIKLTSDNGGADGMTNRRLISVDGDTVTVVKNLRLKGGNSQIKVGTKVRNIRLVNGVGDHDIDCKVDGFGPMQLKSSVVKKV